MAGSRRSFVFLLIIIALLTYFYGYTVFYLALYSMLLMAVLAFVSVHLAYLITDVKESLSGNIISKNESIRYFVRIKKITSVIYSGFSYSLLNSDFVKYKKIPDSESDMDFQITSYELRFPYRGMYEVGLKSIKVTDFIGLFTKEIKINKLTKVTVYPTKDENFSPETNQELIYISDPRASFFDENYDDVADIRKYGESDSMKKVHWKLSAKRNELVVKNFETWIKNKVVLFLDTHNTNLSGAHKMYFEDKIASLSASVLNYCVKNKFPAEFIYGEGFEDKLIVDGKASFDDSLLLLAQLEFDKKNSLKKTVDGFLINDTGKYNIFFVLHRINKEIFESINGLCYLGHTPIVFFVHEGEITETESSLFLKLRENGAYVTEHFCAKQVV